MAAEKLSCRCKYIARKKKKAKLATGGRGNTKSMLERKMFSMAEASQT